MFEIYTKEVEIKEPNGNVVKYKLRPLNGRHLPLLYAVLSKIQKNNVGLSKLSEEERNAKSLESFDEETTAKLHKLILETLKASYPKEDEALLDEFTSQNLMAFFSPIMEINLRNDTK